MDGINELAQKLDHPESPYLIFNYVRMVETANELVNTARGDYTKIIEFKRVTKYIIQKAEPSLGNKPGYS